MESKHRACMVFKKCTFLPSKQAHALSPLEQISCPPFFGPTAKVKPKNYLGTKKWGNLFLDMHFCTHVTIFS